ncbi:hypothetical protein ACFOZ9_09595 [Deinococcus navajonensis]|uniref:Uncharacterized protein n=1 Tax=Deinococcus navajonensis TaxID=309884 RepID=A0ABV8XLL2_9DEIO
MLPGSPLGPARPQATSPAPVSPPEPGHWENPTFELLITVRVLLELNQENRQALSGPVAVQLLRALEPLTRQRTLSAVQAAAVLDSINRALGSRGTRNLREARVRLEQRVQMELASSRYARGEDTPGIATFRLALLVPGGQGTVEAVSRHLSFNPFLQGVPASALRALLLNLKR